MLLQETWLSRRPSPHALWLTVVLCLLLFGISFSVFFEVLGAPQGLPATGQAVFQQGQIWRAWTSLFVHGDLAHFLSNMLLFVPFAHLLTAYFSPVFFPLVGFVVGGLINLVVLQTLPAQVSLVGVSGVVYWMGSAWITLFMLLERRQRLRRRLLVGLGLSIALFAPETYKPEVSYLSHLLGYFAGVFSAGIYYFLNRTKFRAAEVYITEPEEPDFENDLPPSDPYTPDSTVVSRITNY